MIPTLPSRPPFADAPKVSLIVPCYNVQATLQQTLDALSAQSFRNFELIVVIDGATDASETIARAHPDPRLRVIVQPNRGLAGARNTGIFHARGAYLGFCDADDLWSPGKLAAHVAHLDADPAVGISYSGAQLMDDDGRPMGLFQTPRLTGITPALIFRRNPIGNGSAPVMRRAVLDAIAWRPDGEPERDWWFDETFRQSEDIECWLRIALTTGWRFEGVTGAPMFYRVSGGGLSAATDRQLASWDRMVAKLTPLAPAFFARETPAARAYQLRYLCRRAVAGGDAARARALARRFMAQSRVPLRDEPVKTLTTLAAAAALTLAGPAARHLPALRARRLRGA